MRQIVQTHQEGVGNIGSAVPISWLERTTNDRRELRVTKRNVTVKTDAKIVKEGKGPQTVNRTIYPGYDVYYTEDNMIGIAWADVVLK